jgi:hypothetical protein
VPFQNGVSELLSAASLVPLVGSSGFLAPLHADIATSSMPHTIFFIVFIVVSCGCPPSSPKLPIGNFIVIILDTISRNIVISRSQRRVTEWNPKRPPQEGIAP